MTEPAKIMLTAFLLVSHTAPVSGWFWNKNEPGAYTPQSYSDGLYSQSHRKYWVETKKNLRIHYQGCRWGYAAAGEQGCRDDESEDGTMYWYQMANCRRAQVVYSLYGSDGYRESCKTQSFLDTFVTTDGLSNFVLAANNYDQNFPLSYDDVYDLPECQASDDGNGYVSVGCSTDGYFTIDKFYDSYCLKYASTIDDLSSINQKLEQLNCYDCDQGSNDYNYGSSSFCETVLDKSSSCSPLDSKICYNPSNRVTKKYSLNKYIDSDQSTRHGKYLLGTILYIASAGLLVGVMMMNNKIYYKFSALRKKLREKRKKDYGYDVDEKPVEKATEEKPQLT